MTVRPVIDFDANEIAVPTVGAPGAVGAVGAVGAAGSIDASASSTFFLLQAVMIKSEDMTSALSNLGFFIGLPKSYN